jgi:hypothetical protein
VATIAVGMCAGDGLLVELGEEDVGDRVVNGFGCRLEQVGESYVETAFAETDGGVERGEAAEANVERRDGGAGAKFAVLVFEDGDKGGGCGGFLCAGSSGLRGLERCCRIFVKESRGGCWGRRKKLQELAYG